MKEFGGPIGQKYAKIDRAGREALKHEGEIKKFEGFGEGIKRKFSTAFLFSVESEQELQSRILAPLEQIGNEAGINFYLAGRDFPIHSTVEEGLYQGSEESEMNALFSRLSSDEQRVLAEQMPARPLVYNYLLMDKGNVILTATSIPDEIIELRRKLSDFYTKHGLKPLPINDLLHITIGRMTELPASSPKEQFERYRLAMIRLRHEISRAPLELSVSQFYTGSSFKFLQSFANINT